MVLARGGSLAEGILKLLRVAAKGNHLRNSSPLASWFARACQDDPKEIIGSSFLICKITNSLDGTEDDLIYKSDNDWWLLFKGTLSIRLEARVGGWVGRWVGGWVQTSYYYTFTEISKRPQNATYRSNFSKKDSRIRVGCVDNRIH